MITQRVEKLNAMVLLTTVQICGILSWIYYLACVSNGWVESRETGETGEVGEKEKVQEQLYYININN